MLTSTKLKSWDRLEYYRYPNSGDHFLTALLLAEYNGQTFFMYTNLDVFVGVAEQFDEYVTKLTIAGWIRQELVCYL